jgi:hypothetical protein
MNTTLLLPPRVGFAIIILAICLTASSVAYQRSSPSFCFGNVAAGFPLLFICDTLAESPSISWGEIDGADISRLQLKPFLLNVVFYAVAAWEAWVLVLIFDWLQYRRRRAK